MFNTRKLWALLALALVLFLAACSTPEDLNSGGLEVQFGGNYDDIGIDTVINSGSAYVLSEELGSEYFYSEYYGET